MRRMADEQGMSGGIVVVIENEVHGESGRVFQTFDDAVAELRRRAVIPWDRPPNLAPCTSWATCGREYNVAEYDTARQPSRLLRDVSVLKVSREGVEWTPGFEAAWRAAATT